MCATGALFKGHRMESLTNMYNEMHDTGDDGIEDAQKDDQLDKEKSEDEESFIGEESGEEESDNEENESDPLAENEEKKSKTSTKLTLKVMARCSVHIHAAGFSEEMESSNKI